MHSEQGCLSLLRSKIVIVIRWQVALLSGLDDEAVKGVIKSKAHDGVHLNNALKLITIRKEKGKERQGIALPGGPYIPSVDGAGDPSK